MTLNADRYAVIGNPVAHSKSPQIHAAFAAQTGQSISYEHVLAPVDGFGRTVRGLIERGYAGANITLPFKQDAFELADNLSQRAIAAGSANTFKFTSAGIQADNTDGVGLVRDLTHNLSFALAGSRILLLGAGGAARGVIQPLLDAGAGQLLIANRTHARAVELSARFGFDVEPTLLDLLDTPFDLVINATSTSLSGQRLRLPDVICGASTLAYDMMYSKTATPFMQWAAGRGARTADGLGMLVEQAAAAFTWWRGVAPETAPVLAQLRAQMTSPKTGQAAA
jgi:shikimate dehydrogenase